MRRRNLAESLIFLKRPEEVVIAAEGTGVEAAQLKNGARMSSFPTAVRTLGRFGYIRRMRWRERPVVVRVLGVWLLIGCGAALQAWLTWFGPHNDRLIQLAKTGPVSDPYLTATA